MAKLTETHPATGLRVSVHMTYACVTQVECVAYWNRCSRLAHAFMDFNGWAVQESFFFMIIQTCSEGQIPCCRATFNGSINQVGLHQYSDFLKYDN